MIQTPKTQQQQSDYGIYFFLLALWIVPGLVLALAAVLAGGAPHTHVIDWPYLAIRGAAQGHFHPNPWQWVGADEVRSPGIFYGVVIVVTALLVAGLILALVALRGGLPAFFPFLSQPPARSRWASSQGLMRAGLVASGAEGQRLVLGRHRDHLVAVREGTSVLAIGAPGSGKSGALCIPAIGDWDGCVVAVSDGTDLIEASAGVRQRRGQVDVLDLPQRTGLGTCTWSATGVDMSFDEAVALVSQVLGSRDPAPDEATRQVLTCALYAAANQGVGVAGAVTWLDDLTGAALVRALLHVADRDPRATSWATRVVELDRDQRAACFSAARQLLRAHFEQASPSVAGRAFQPAEFLAGAFNTLFVIVPGTGAPAASRSVAALLRTLAADAGQLGHRRPLLVVLDGCPAVTAMPDLAEYLEDHSMAVTVLATLPDLEECGAGAEWDMRALADKARAVVVLGGGVDAAEGGRPQLMHHLVQRQLALRRGRAPWGDRQPDLLPPDAARHLGYGRAVLVHERMAPVVLWTRSCYEDPELQERNHESPYVRGVARIHEAS